MIYFSTRDKARKFSGGSRKLVDMGKDNVRGRWAVKVVNLK